MKKKSQGSYGGQSHFKSKVDEMTTVTNITEGKMPADNIKACYPNSRPMKKKK